MIPVILLLYFSKVLKQPRTGAVLHSSFSSSKKTMHEKKVGEGTNEEKKVDIRKAEASSHARKHF